jgi:hypothetical protein
MSKPEEVSYEQLARLGMPVNAALFTLLKTLVREWPTPCKGCATLREAETVLLESQGVFPRSALETRILTVLRQQAHSVVQLSNMLGVPRAQVSVTCRGLLLLGTLERWGHGHYRYRSLTRDISA